MKKCLSILMTIVVVMVSLFSLTIMSSAAPVKDKYEIKAGDVIDVVKYDVQEDSYVYGTMKAKYHKPSGETHQYMVLDESTFSQTSSETAPAKQSRK